jgi:hypothetical protein
MKTSSTYISWPFAKLVVFWYIFPHFGLLFKEKSGNPAQKLFFNQIRF